MSNECRKTDAWLVDFLDRTLSARRRERLEAHVAGCSECWQKLDQTRLVLETSQELAGTGEVPPAVAHAVLQESIRVLSEAPPGPRRRTLVPALVGVGLTVLVLAALTVLGVTAFESKTEGQPGLSPPAAADVRTPITAEAVRDKLDGGPSPATRASEKELLERQDDEIRVRLKGLGYVNAE